MKTTPIILIWFFALVLGLHACSPGQPVEGLPERPTATLLEVADTPSPAETHAQTVPLAVDAARRAAAAQVGMEVDEVQVIDYQEEEWPDSCLGWSSLGEVCTQSSTPGFGGRLQAGEEKFEFRSDKSGVLVRLMPGAAVASQLFLAKELGIDSQVIQIAAVDVVDWPDSCLGVQGEGCQPEITPGYQVVLNVDENAYLVHSDRIGDRLVLAGAPDARNEISAIIWTDEVDGDCYHATIGAESVEITSCDGEAGQRISLTSTIRSTEFQGLTRLFAMFSTETSAGKIELSGPGQVTPSTVQQRMIAEWARLITLESLHGSEGISGEPVLNWHRETGESGFCQELAIESSGFAVAISCSPEAQVELGRARLTTLQLKPFYDWLDGLKSFELETTQLLEDGFVATRLAFIGRGGKDAMDLDQRDMDAFAQQLMIHLSQPQDEQEIEAARQALISYLDALKQGNYADVAELYAGDIKVLEKSNPDIPAEDQAALFQAACTQNGFVCDLSILNELSARKITPTGFRFVVELQDPDGAKFALGSCCGSDPSGESMVTQFEFYVEKVGEKYRIMTLPIYSA